MQGIIEFGFEIIMGAVGLVLFGFVDVKLGEWCDRHGGANFDAAFGGIFWLFGFSAGMIFAVGILHGWSS